MPNLSLLPPVEIFFIVLASIFGFSLRPIFTTHFFLLAIFVISLTSFSDSALISNISLVMA
jgi:ABC-type multidrug transport system permease subunit